MISAFFSKIQSDQKLNSNRWLIRIALTVAWSFNVKASGSKSKVRFDGGIPSVPVETPQKKVIERISRNCYDKTPEGYRKTRPEQNLYTLGDFFKKQYLRRQSSFTDVYELWKCGSEDPEVSLRPLFKTKGEYIPGTPMRCVWNDIPIGIQKQTDEIPGEWGVYQYVSLVDVTYTVKHHQHWRQKQLPSEWKENLRQRRPKSFEQQITFEAGEKMYIGKAGGKSGIKKRTMMHTYGKKQLCDKIFQIAKKYKIKTGKDLIGIQWMQLKDIREKFKAMNIIEKSDENMEILEKLCHSRMESILMDAHKRAHRMLPKLNIMDDSERRKEGGMFGNHLQCVYGAALVAKPEESISHRREIAKKALRETRPRVDPKSYIPFDPCRILSCDSDGPEVRIEELNQESEDGTPEYTIIDPSHIMQTEGSAIENRVITDRLGERLQLSPPNLSYGPQKTPRKKKKAAGGPYELLNLQLYTPARKDEHRPHQH